MSVGPEYPGTAMKLSISIEKWCSKEISQLKIVTMVKYMKVKARVKGVLTFMSWSKKVSASCQCKAFNSCTSRETFDTII